MVILHKRVVGTNEDSLDRFVKRAKRAVGLRGAVTVLIATSRELQTLNARFRRKPTPTDVLSFPQALAGARQFAGDIAISAEIAAQNARRLGHSVEEEIKILALHGLLHLAGYDHETDNGRMGRRETQLRKKLGLPGALIERARLAEKRTMPENRRGLQTAQRKKTARPRSTAARSRAR